MKKITIYISLFLLLLINNAMAYDWSSAGMQVTSSGTAEDENFVILRDARSNEIKVRFQGELSNEAANTIINLNKKFREWQYMKPDKIEFYAGSSSIEVLVIPATFKYENTDFIPYIPGGMTFIYDYAFRYNFRVTKNDIFVRLNDKFMDEKSLCLRLKDAIDDPISYLKKREPEYFLQKLNELEENMAQLQDRHDKLVKSVLYFENGGFLGLGKTPVKNNVIKRVIEIKTKDASLNAEKIKEILNNEKIEASDKEIRLILTVFYNEFEK